MLDFKKLLMLSLTVGLISCSTSPPFLSPSKTLVVDNDAQMGVSIPSKYNRVLASKEGQKIIVIDDKKVTLGEFYTSALGHQCRLLVISDKKGSLETLNQAPLTERKRIVCKLQQSESWQMVPLIIEQANQSVVFTK